MKILRVFYNNHIKFPSSHASRRDYLNEYPLHDMPRINMKKNKKIIKANKKRESSHNHEKHGWVYVNKRLIWRNEKWINKKKHFRPPSCEDSVCVCDCHNIHNVNMPSTSKHAMMSDGKNEYKVIQTSHNAGGFRHSAYNFFCITILCWRGH